MSKTFYHSSVESVFATYSRTIPVTVLDGYRVSKVAADAKTLRVAASSNNIESAQSSLHRGADPNCVDRFGRSPLHLASCSGYSEIVK